MTGIRRWLRGLPAVLAVALLLAGGSGSAYAQSRSSGNAAPSNTNEPYRVGKGDVIRVDVAGRTDLSGAFTVADDGTVTIPTVGNIRVQGRTANEIRSDLSRRISLFDRSSPTVTVTVA